VAFGSIPRPLTIDDVEELVEVVPDVGCPRSGLGGPLPPPPWRSRSRRGARVATWRRHPVAVTTTASTTVGVGTEEVRATEILAIIAAWSTVEPLKQLVSVDGGRIEIDRHRLVGGHRPAAGADRPRPRRPKPRWRKVRSRRHFKSSASTATSRRRGGVGGGGRKEWEAAGRRPTREAGRQLEAAADERDGGRGIV